jgi:hypothetical protein
MSKKKWIILVAIVAVALVIWFKQFRVSQLFGIPASKAALIRDDARAYGKILTADYAAITGWSVADLIALNHELHPS